MLGSVGMTEEEEEEEVGGRTTSSYTAMFVVWRGAPEIKVLYKSPVAKRKLKSKW